MQNNTQETVHLKKRDILLLEGEFNKNNKDIPQKLNVVITQKNGVIRWLMSCSHLT